MMATTKTRRMSEKVAMRAMSVVVIEVMMVVVGEGLTVRS
jgi:hypothetical protein